MSPQPVSNNLARSSSHEVGRVTHYYPRAAAGVVELTRGTLSVGDTVHIHGHTSDFVQRVTSIRVDDQEVESASAPATLGLKLDQASRTGDRVDRVAS